MRNTSSEKFLILIIPVLVLNALGCEPSFDPIKENDVYFFSMFGYLDANADTQWVRIAPIREQLSMPAEVPDMEIILQESDNGQRILMNDSLFTKSGTNFVNAWTTMQIKQNTTYLISAKDSEGQTSHVTLTTPPDYPTPRLRHEAGFFGEPDSYTLFIEGVERIAEVQTKWYLETVTGGIHKKRVVTFSYRNELNQTSEGEYRINIVPQEEQDQIAIRFDRFEVLHRQVFVASGGPEWMEDMSMIEDKIYALPNGTSNVENGLGYVVGINSSWIPYKECVDENNIHTACPEEKPYW